MVGPGIKSIWQGDEDNIPVPQTDREIVERGGLEQRAVAVAQEAGGGQAVALFLPQPGDPSSTYTIWVSQEEGLTPRQSHSNVTVTVDPGTGRATVLSTPGRGPTARTGKYL